MTETVDTQRKKLRIRAWRRGFKEADLILGRFADQSLDSMSADEVAAFEHLLDQPDQDIYEWIVGRAEAPAAFEGPVLEALRKFRVDQDAEFGDGPKQ